MHQWRISKYDPRFRRAGGAYRRHTWTSIADVGHRFEGTLLTPAAYLAVERRYLASIAAFMAATPVTTLALTALEPYAPPPSLATLQVGHTLADPQLEALCRAALREQLWCKLAAAERFFLHFGYDYYIYIGSDAPCEAAVQRTRALGLFAEPMPSPYHDSH